MCGRKLCPSSRFMVLPPLFLNPDFDRFLDPSSVYIWNAWLVNYRKSIINQLFWANANRTPIYHRIIAKSKQNRWTWIHYEWILLDKYFPFIIIFLRCELWCICLCAGKYKYGIMCLKQLCSLTGRLNVFAFCPTWCSSLSNYYTRYINYKSNFFWKKRLIDFKLCNVMLSNKVGSPTNWRLVSV